jgi:hypothetical protein
MHYRTTMVFGLIASLLIAFHPIRVAAADDPQVVQQVSVMDRETFVHSRLKTSGRFNGTPKVQC